MDEIFKNLNWLAIFSGFGFSIGLGAIWFSPNLFGIKWAQGTKVDLNLKPRRNPKALVPQVIGTFLLAWFIAIAASNNQLYMVIVALLAFATLKSASGFFTQKSNYAVLTESGFILAMGTVMIIAHALVRA